MLLLNAGDFMNNRYMILCTLIVTSLNGMEDIPNTTGINPLLTTINSQTITHINRTALGMPPRTACENYIRELQGLIGFFLLQHTLFILAHRINNGTTACFYELPGVKKLLEKWRNISDNQEILKQYINIIVICIIFSHHILHTKPHGSLLCYDFLSLAEETSKRTLICSEPHITEGLISRLNTFKTKIQPILDSYSDLHTLLMIDDQYQEILHALRLELIHMKQRKHYPQNRKDSDSIPRYQDTILSPQERTSFQDEIAFQQKHIDETLLATDKCGLSMTKLVLPPSPKSARPHKIARNYNMNNSVAIKSQGHIRICDVDNAMDIDIDLSQQKTLFNTFGSSTMMNHYSTDIIHWFLFNCLKKAKRMLTKNPSLKSKSHIIQSNRFSPLVDQYLESAGYEYLDLSDGKKQCTILPDNTIHQESWLAHAHRYKLQAIFRIELDALVHSYTTDETLPCIFRYRVDPQTNQIITRRMDVLEITS